VMLSVAVSGPHGELMVGETEMIFQRIPICTVQAAHLVAAYGPKSREGDGFTHVKNKYGEVVQLIIRQGGNCQRQ